ncbi:HlyU family transcriptional regulator [Amphritea balenae]|uniref:Uncharacterized protein n=1 Tax=Amphritea balenae TaxID=452629 RepID=A0A3P1STN9_9GAMM|nr:HlyU family transcriptional regulator [Amphritea balenae]RRD00574.1 hypothetical protein EHS89_05660 [Amphritea balenae]GGK69639.1 hypothetical protein GCM10007941_19800 [Amphritea balenae]
MSFLSSIKSIFSAAEPESKEPQAMASVEYNGFTITPAPASEGSGFRINGTITKGELSHTFIRADTLPSTQMCADEMVRKAKQMIDQQGDRIF